jgi:exopolysaccharide biosynthesis operon protein EpsL
MIKRSIKIELMTCFMLVSTSSLADGVIDFDPYVNSDITYDDNLFRFSSDAEAESSGYSKSDVVKTIGAGVEAKLSLSRQLISLSAELNQNRYNQNSFLDNNGKSLNLGWNWQLGSDVYGVLSTSNTESISGFDNNNDRLKNSRVINKKHADINWNFLPSWVLHATREYSDLKNDQASYQYLDREDDTYEVGVQYSNPLGTQLGLFYRIVDSDYQKSPNTFFYGTARTQEQLGVTMAWMPSQKTRVNGQVSQTKFNRENGLQKDFNGVNQRWNITYLLTEKTNVNLTAYKEASSVDDFFASYVEYTGLGAKATWNATSKVSFSGGLSYEEREFLGNSLTGVPSNADDQSRRANLSMVYKPTDKALIQIRYSSEKREASTPTSSFQFNNINFFAQYNF